MDFREIVTDSVRSLRLKAKKGSLWTKWFWYLLAGSVGLLLIGYIVYDRLNKSNKVAKVLHERDVLIEKSRQEKVNAVIAETQTKVDKHVAKSAEHVEKAQEKQKEVEKLQERAKTNQGLIDSLETWDDVEDKIKW